MEPIIARLLDTAEPAVRLQVRTRVMGQDERRREVRQLQQDVRCSERVQTLLHDREPDGRLRPLHHVYKKWTGAHWVLVALAEIGYPPGDEDLIPIRDQVLDCWLAPDMLQECVLTRAPSRQQNRGVPIIRGRARRCASQQGNALFAAIRLGFMDDRCHQLADCLLRWQWPDGGWNCDRRPEADSSSFWESLIPLRALSAYAAATARPEAHRAAGRAAELFLHRRLFRRKSDGGIMNPQFIRLHYPCYWRYDLLFALKVMAEAGLIGDERCGDALDLLGSMRLADGGWPAEERFYQNSRREASGYDAVSWGGVDRRKMNEWVTSDALFVLRAAGRLSA